MSAVSISLKDMEILQTLQARLKLRSKSRVIHLALAELMNLIEREHLARQIRQSVKKCALADLKENMDLTGGAAFYSGEDS